MQWNLSYLNQMIPSNIELLYYKYNKNTQSSCQNVFFYSVLCFSDVIFFHGHLLNIYTFFLHTSASSFKTSCGLPRIAELIHTLVLREKTELKVIQRTGLPCWPYKSRYGWAHWRGVGINGGNRNLQKVLQDFFCLYGWFHKLLRTEQCKVTWKN